MSGAGTYCIGNTTYPMEAGDIFVFSSNEFQTFNLHLAEPITLADVAYAVHLPPSYLASLFKDFFQVSLWSYIITKRIEKAISLLMDKNNQYTISEIALQCGFNNTTNFNRAFRKHTGLTPGEYRDTPPQQL